MERQNLASCFACPKSLNKCDDDDDDDDDVLSYALSFRRNLEGGGDLSVGDQHRGGRGGGGPRTPMNSGIGRFRFYDLCIATTNERLANAILQLLHGRTIHIADPNTIGFHCTAKHARQLLIVGTSE